MSDAITAPADGKWIRQAHKTLTTLSSKPVKTAGKVDKRTLATLSSLGLLEDATAPWGFSETARRVASFKRRVALPFHGGVEVAWPHALDSDWECSAEKIAHTGMFYAPLSPDEPDHAACQYCQLGLAGWESDDDPIHEHRKRSPDCIMFLGPEVLTKFGLLSLPTARPASISIVIESNKFTAAKDDSDVEQSTNAMPSKSRRLNTNTTSVRSSVGSSLDETLGKDTKQNLPAVDTAKSNPISENIATNDQENAPAEEEAPAKKKPAPRSKKVAAVDAPTTKTVKARATKAAAAKSIENEESAKDAPKAADTTATTVRPTRRRVLAPAAAVAAAESAGSTNAVASKPAARRGRKKAVAVVIEDEDQEPLSTNAAVSSSADILVVGDGAEPFKAAAESAGSTNAVASKPAATRGRKKAVAVVIEDEDQEPLSTNAAVSSSANILVVGDGAEPFKEPQSKSSVVPTSVTVPPPEFPAMHKVVASYNPNTAALKADFAQMMLDLEEELKTHDVDEPQQPDEQAEKGEAAAGKTELQDVMRTEEPQNNDESHGDIFDCYSEDGGDEQTVILRQKVSDPRDTEAAVCETTQSQLLDAYFDTCQDPEEFSDDSQIVDPESLTQKCVVAYSRPEDFTSFCKLILEESPFEPVSSFASLSSEERRLTVGEFLKRKAAKEIERVRSGSRKMIEIVQEESLKARKVFEGLDV
ncbi:hypothetical protein HDU80_000454 [Chytriomyces hyalinus]|nr:hypothetical protein HDU80_000454 [Chytriomyces hyalinus]